VLQQRLLPVDRSVLAALVISWQISDAAGFYISWQSTVAEVRFIHRALLLRCALLSSQSTVAEVLVLDGIYRPPVGSSLARRHSWSAGTSR